MNVQKHSYTFLYLTSGLQVWLDNLRKTLAERFYTDSVMYSVFSCLCNIFILFLNDSWFILILFPLM